MADTFALDELRRRLDPGRRDFAEFFRSPSGSLSMTVARWPAGSIDDQQPHGEDEVYYVAAGRATLTIGDETVAVGPGTVAFVAAGVDHRFRDIAAHLEVLVFWSPARHSNAAG